MEKKRYIKAGTNFSILHTYFDNLFMIGVMMQMKWLTYIAKYP